MWCSCHLRTSRGSHRTDGSCGHCLLCRTDTTRVEFTIPLRENWALPFFAVQIAAITYFLRPNLRPLSEVSP